MKPYQLRNVVLRSAYCPLCGLKPTVVDALDQVAAVSQTVSHDGPQLLHRDVLLWVLLHVFDPVLVKVDSHHSIEYRVSFEGVRSRRAKSWQSLLIFLN